MIAPLDVEDEGCCDESDCVVCGRFAKDWELATCDGCGNAICRACSVDDDFGTVRCDDECGA